VTSRRSLPSTTSLSIRRAKIVHSTSASTPPRPFQVLVCLMSSPVSHLLLTPPPVFRLGTSAISQLHVCKPSSPARQRMSPTSRIQSRASLVHRVHGRLSWWAFLMAMISNGPVVSHRPDRPALLSCGPVTRQWTRKEWKKKIGTFNILVERLFFKSEMTALGTCMNEGILEIFGSPYLKWRDRYDRPLLDVNSPDLLEEIFAITRPRLPHVEIEMAIIFKNGRFQSSNKGWVHHRIWIQNICNTWHMYKNKQKKRNTQLWKAVDLIVKTVRYVWRVSVISNYSPLIGKKHNSSRLRL